MGVWEKWQENISEAGHECVQQHLVLTESKTVFGSIFREMDMLRNIAIDLIKTEWIEDLKKEHSRLRDSDSLYLPRLSLSFSERRITRAACNLADSTAP